MKITHNGWTLIGVYSMDDTSGFNTMRSDLKNCYGAKNVWFDRDYKNRRILFLTH